MSNPQKPQRLSVERAMQDARCLALYIRREAKPTRVEAEAICTRALGKEQP